MTPTQSQLSHFQLPTPQLSHSQLWRFLGQPHWHCAHPERLPLAPVAAAEVLIVTDVITDVVTDLVTDAILDASLDTLLGHLASDLRIALSLDESQLRVISHLDWLNAGQPSARILLGVNVSCDTQAFHWHASFPLSIEQKRALWSTLCRCYLDH